MVARLARAGSSSAPAPAAMACRQSVSEQTGTAMPVGRGAAPGRRALGGRGGRLAQLGGSSAAPSVEGPREPRRCVAGLLLVRCRRCSGCLAAAGCSGCACAAGAAGAAGDGTALVAGAAAIGAGSAAGAGATASTGAAADMVSGGSSAAALGAPAGRVCCSVSGAAPCCSALLHSSARGRPASTAVAAWLKRAAALLRAAASASQRCTRSCADGAVAGHCRSCSPACQLRAVAVADRREGDACRAGEAAAPVAGRRGGEASPLPRTLRFCSCISATSRA